MLALVFDVLGEQYGMPAARVLEVVRRPVTRAVPGAPAWILGLFAHGDEWVPLVDLSRLIARVPCPDGAASRVALVTHASGGRARTLGLLAPGMTRVSELSSRRPMPGLAIPGHEFLGAIALDEEQGVQLLELDRVLPPEIDTLLFAPSAP